MPASIPREVIVRMAVDAKIFFNKRLLLLGAVTAYLSREGSFIERLPISLGFKERTTTGFLLNAKFAVMASNDQIILQREHLHYNFQFVFSEHIVVER